MSTLYTYPVIGPYHEARDINWAQLVAVSAVVSDALEPGQQTPAVLHGRTGRGEGQHTLDVITVFPRGLFTLLIEYVTSYISGIKVTCPENKSLTCT